MMVGEQPGDVEDREGHPFVGPAGRVLDEALEEVGIVRRGDGASASILRAPDPETRESEGRAFVADLRTVRKLLETN
jgi:uracil-DNA glycosylase family 4